MTNRPRTRRSGSRSSPSWWPPRSRIPRAAPNWPPPRRGRAAAQAALRRVATLVGKGASSDELFAAVAREVADVIDVPLVALQRYEPDRTFTMVGIAGETSFTVGSRWPVEDEGVAGMILATGRPARKQDYTTMPG